MKDNKSPETNLKEKTAKGLLWGGISNGLQQLLNLFFGIFLARLLTADDYGMVGMLTVFATIASALQESGFIAALTQKKEVTEQDYNAVFWFNIGCGGILYLLLFFAAPLIADFFNEPDLIWLGRILFLSFVISSFGIVPRAILFRHIKAQENAKISIISLVVSGITGVTLAWNGFAYWGIAIQGVVFCLFVTFLSFYYSKWHPTMKPSFTPLKGMIGFSSKLLITNIFNQINNNIFSVLLGKFYSKKEVGYYNQANKWTTMGYTLINGMILGVAQPVFSRMQGDEERERRAFRKMLRFTAFIACPVLFGIALIAKEVIVIAITDKWLPSAEIMQILCIGGAFIPIAQLYSNFMTSQGKSNIYMYNTIALCVTQLVTMLLLAPFGIRTMIFVYVTINTLWIFSWHYFLWRLIRLPLWNALLDVLPFAFIAALVMVITYFITSSIENIYGLLFSKIGIAAFLYFIIMKLLHVKTLEESLDFLLKRKVRNG